MKEKHKQSTLVKGLRPTLARDLLASVGSPNGFILGVNVIKIGFFIHLSMRANVVFSKLVVNVEPMLKEGK